MIDRRKKIQLVEQTVIISVIISECAMIETSLNY